jgi:formate--tetrahydrofolate ligase
MLAAFVDRHIFYGNDLKIDPFRVSWRRAVDMNDRHLRNIITGLGGPTHGFPRETGFDIVAASEVMAIMGMATSLKDLRTRIGAITVGYDRDGAPVTAEQMGCAARHDRAAQGRAAEPDQTLEGQPASCTSGRSGVLHGNSWWWPTRPPQAGRLLHRGLPAATWAWKFMDTSAARRVRANAVVIVATAKALKHHAGSRTTRNSPPTTCVIEQGWRNLACHPQRQDGVPAWWPPTASLATPARGSRWCRSRLSDSAHAAVLNQASPRRHRPEGWPRPWPRRRPAEHVQPVRGRRSMTSRSRRSRPHLPGGGGRLPADARQRSNSSHATAHWLSICMAKTHLSLSIRPPAPRGFRIPVKDMPYTGAGF